jgi:SNF2 family DNA or RNA helicase
MLLGQATCIYPALKTKTKTKLLSSMELSTEQALSFLMYYADIIVQSGFSLLLPAWWKGKNTTSGLSLSLKVKSPAMQSNAGMTLDSILEYDYRACIGTEDLSVEELHKLAKLKTPLVQIRGQWTYVNQEQIAETLKFLHKQQTTSLTGKDLVKIALGTQLSPIPLERLSIDGWVSKFYDELTGKQEFRQLKQPKHFSGKLRHYQEKGYSWLAFLKQWGLGACLADDMGLGKTVQALALLQSDREAGEKRPVLLICPTTVINNWLKEATRFTPEIKTLVHHGVVRQKSEAFIKSAAKQGLVISSFGLLHRDLEFINQVNWAGVIVDEAQNIKNPQTMQSQAVRTLKAGYRIAMTGTPVENHVGDLWSIMDFLNPGLLGSAQNFKTRFHRQITLYHDKPTVEMLKKITSPFILRRLKTDKNIIKDLPDKIENKEYCTLTKEQASLYQAVADEVQNQVENADGIARKGIVLAAITRLKQVCNHPVQYAADNSALPGRSGKLERLLEILYEIQENNEKTLIFTQYAEMGAILKKAVQDHFGKEVLFLHGALSKKKRDELVERFQSDTNAPGIFILSLKAGGTGLTLTQANHVIHYDRWWNPAVENQATDRAFRIGQKKNVQVHKFIVAGTLEEKIDMLMEKKAVIATSVVGSGEAWLSELSNDDFRKLISLSKTALGE